MTANSGVRYCNGSYDGRSGGENFTRAPLGLPSSGLRLLGLPIPQLYHAMDFVIGHLRSQLIMAGWPPIMRLGEFMYVYLATNPSLCLLTLVLFRK
ncbi:unnamed protein product [Protopolystoma xenopodis]|uniref:Uncharacterized protein n=1 Tax=Protopolystoma xenopodis TaxID=117903 RepID=A0A3S5B0T1_9PLAT|nr:unnamed protein product [Protopolystoma xenopodis]